MVCTAEAAKCVVHLGRSYPREDPSCSGLVPTAKTTLNPAHVRPRPERRALHKEPRLDDTIRPSWTTSPATGSPLKATKVRRPSVAGPPRAASHARPFGVRPRRPKR